MKAATVLSRKNSHTQLEQARSLVIPSRQDMLAREPSVQRFWDNNRQLLANAWGEWEEDAMRDLVIPDETLIDSHLLNAVKAAWKKPDSESAVHKLWHEAAPGVYMAQFFDPEKLSDLRHYLNEVAHAGIPLKPPYGIVLNRHGAMLDERSEGYLAAPKFQVFYRQILDEFMRPVARLLFPEVMGYDAQTFGFSIQWQAGMDTSLRLHTDASAVTMNVNMNLPGEEFTGSEVDFYDPITGKMNRLNFEPGTAMIHRGNIAHAAQPILSGERSNMVFWLYGDHMRIPEENVPQSAVDARQRWALPLSKRDNVAPF